MRPVAVAMATEYDLAAAVFVRDIARADVAGRIESGICRFDAPTARDGAQTPFGGVNDDNQPGR